MDIRDVLITLKAVEFMSYGVDISEFNEDDYKGYVNVVTKQYISRLSPNVQDFVWHLDADCVEMLELFGDHVIRIGREFKVASVDDDQEGYLTDRTVNIELNKETLISTMQLLYAKHICHYNGISEDILDPNLRKRLEEIDSTFDRAAYPSGQIVKQLSKENIKRDFEIITAVAYSDAPITRDAAIDAFNSSYDKFEVEALKDYQVIDDRVYIGISEADRYRIKAHMKEHNWEYKDSYDDMKYIVVSKNLYDYYFCSYGSEFQSCFSINSQHFGGYGTVAFGTRKGHYIIYGTKDKAQKTSITSTGSKWTTPYMYFRCWGWLGTDNNMYVDKPYTNSSSFYRAVEETLLKKLFKCHYDSDKVALKYASQYLEDRQQEALRYYADSITFETMEFRYDRGNHSFSGKQPKFNNSTLLEELQSINSVTDSFNPKSSIKIDNGVLFNPKKCPVTGLYIPEEESRSFYAKYLNSPVQHGLAVITWCEGYYHLEVNTVDCREGSLRILDVKDTTSYQEDNQYVITKRYSGIPNMNLKSFKEFLKGHINSTNIDVILLRVIEEDKVTFIKYKKKGVQA